MVTENNIRQHLSRASLQRGALIGASAAFILVGGFLSILLIGAGNMSLGAWIIPPVAIASFGGTIGGLSYCIMRHFIPMQGWKRTILDILFVLTFLAGLWLCMVLGLAMVGLWD